MIVCSQGRQNGRDLSPRRDGTGSYADNYRNKKNKKIEYKEYTVDDYRKMKKEVRLGGLGPDLDNDNTKERVGITVLSFHQHVFTHTEQYAFGLVN